jgi:hypothetical protein
LKKILLASVFTGLMAFPAFAQMSQDTTCGAFMAMNADAQMKAIDATSGDNMMADDMAAGDDMASGGSMMADDNMASGDMKPDAMAPSVDAVAAACAGKPDMMLHDAMMAAESH